VWRVSGRVVGNTVPARHSGRCELAGAGGGRV